VRVNPVSVPVYDLTVDGCHEFFAAGVLVHNSVALAAWVGERSPWGDDQPAATGGRRGG
jgi:hypothetical protein